MAKAKLEFDLNDHDDRMHHLRCVKSTDMAIVLFQLSYNTKKECENIVDGVEGKAGSDMQKGVDLVFKKIYELLDEHNINIDEILD